MKKMLAIILTLVLVVSIAPSEYVHAAEMVDSEAGFRHEEVNLEYDADPHFNYEKTIIYYVDCEEDSYSVEIDPELNIRYIFEWETPSKARAVCYNCGKSTMSTVTRKILYAYYDKTCPLTYGPGLYNDLFFEYHHYAHERCTACGYQGEEWLDRKSYTATCGNVDPMNEQVWEVRMEYTQAAGYDPHQSLSWWLEGKRI